MQVFYSDGHRRHAPTSFISRGEVVQCPETPKRADILLAAVTEAGHDVVAPKPFGLQPIGRVHDSEYLDFLDQAWTHWSQLPTHGGEMIPNVHPNRHMQRRPQATVGLAGYYQADTACPISAGTWEAARTSTDCALSAADQVLGGQAENFAYALCRPPGHHAFSDMAGGFCFLNNTAITAQYCRDHGAHRVAIVDVDVHHGNGTQQIFYSRDDVMTVSLHGDPNAYYPFFLGYSDEKGAGAGDGHNVNFPLPEGMGDADYLENLATALRRVQAFRPDVLVVALGLDASIDDGHHPFLRITTPGFAAIGRALGGLQLPTILVQEGGYVSDSLGNNLHAALDGFEQAR